MVNNPNFIVKINTEVNQVSFGVIIEPVCMHDVSIIASATIEIVVEINTMIGF